MNNNDPNQTLAQLQQLGLIAHTGINTNAVGDSSDSNNLSDSSHDNMHDNTPWFLQVFFGFSGILSSIFLVGFLTLILYQADIFDNSGFQLAVGIALSAAAFALFKNEKSRNNTFLNSLAFAISGAGQLYLMFALFDSEIAEPLSIWLFLLIQVTMTIIMPNFIYRLLSSMAALGGMVYLLSFHHFPELSLGLLALVTIVAHLQRYELLQYLPVKWRTAGFDISKAIAYASALMLLCVSVYFIAAEYGRDFISDSETFRYNYILSQGLLILASLYATHIILKRYHIKLLSIKSISQPDIIIVCAIVIVGIMSVYVSGLLATSLIIVIAMANSQRVLLGLGVLALISYIFWYYYQLDTSLLLKSGSMLVIGIVMLIIRWLLVSRYFANDDSLSTLSKALADKPTNHIDSQERSQ